MKKMQNTQTILNCKSLKSGGKPEKLPLDLRENVQNEMKVIAEETFRETFRSLKRMIDVEEEEAKMMVKWSRVKEQAVKRGIQNTLQKYATKMKEREKKDWGKLRRRIEEEQSRKKEEVQNDVQRTSTERLTILKAVGYKVPQTDGSQDEYRFVPTCSTCHRASSQLMVCEACMVTWYCDEWCQRKDWQERHASLCKSLQIDQEDSYTFL